MKESNQRKPQRTDTFIVNENSKLDILSLKNKRLTYDRQKLKLKVAFKQISEKQTQFNKEICELNEVIEVKNKIIEEGKLDKITLVQISNEILELEVKKEIAHNFRDSAKIQYKDIQEQTSKLTQQNVSKKEVSMGYLTLEYNIDPEIIEQYEKDFERADYFYDGNNQISGISWSKSREIKAPVNPLKFLDMCSKDISDNQKKQESIKIAIAGLLCQRTVAESLAFLVENYQSDLGKCEQVFINFLNHNEQIYQRVDKKTFVTRVQASLPYIILDEDFHKKAFTGNNIYFINKDGNVEKKSGDELGGDVGSIVRNPKTKELASDNFITFSVESTLTFDENCEPHFSQVIEVQYNPNTGIKYVGPEYDYMQIVDNRKWFDDYSLLSLDKTRYMLGYERSNKIKETDIVNKIAIGSGIIPESDEIGVVSLNYKKHIFPHEIIYEKELENKLEIEPKYTSEIIDPKYISETKDQKDSGSFLSYFSFSMPKMSNMLPSFLSTTKPEEKTQDSKEEQNTLEKPKVTEEQKSDQVKDQIK